MILASQEQIRRYTGLGCWGERTRLDDFRDHARRTPERTAVVDPPNKEELMGLAPERISYKALHRAVEGVATALRAAGLEKDDVVLAQIPNSWELAMLYLAVARAGGVLSPVPVQWRPRELAYVARLTRARAFVTVESHRGFDHLAQARALAEQVPSLRQVLSVAEIRRMARETPDPGLDRIRVDANDIFTICWTSGTEAQPKGCPLSHNNWRCQASLAASAGLRPGDVLLTAGPLVNMGALGTVYAPWLILGGTMVLHHPFDPALLLRQMVEEKIHYTLLVPAVVNLILKHPAADSFDLGGIRSITVGSAPPSLWAMREFKRRWDIDIGNIWGQNEGTGLVSTSGDVPDMEVRVDHFPRYGVKGRTWASPVTRFVETRVVDEQDRELVQDGAVGELLYRGPNVMPGYFNRPDLNEQAFDEEGFFRTGDLFRIRGEHYLSFVDRKKDIIIRGGMNISAQEVENLILAHPDVQDAAVVGMPDQDLGERCCAYVVPRAGARIRLEDLTSFMRDQGVAVYKLPERLELVDQIPRNPVGKVLKARLREDIRAKLAQSVEGNRADPREEDPDTKET